jgi:hypothetical protein
MANKKKVARGTADSGHLISEPLTHLISLLGLFERIDISQCPTLQMQ